MTSEQAPGPGRVDYEGPGLAEEELAATPYQQVTQWVAEARHRHEQSGDVPEPMSMAVATVDADGAPDVRTVLMRFLDPRGPGFVTDLGSAKGQQMAGDPRVAITLTWPAMFRAIRFRGTAQRVEQAEVRAYFGSRPWASRISAWASQQSRPVSSRDALQQAYDAAAARYPDHGGADDVPLPPQWGAWRVEADRVEFWAGRRNRLHDRLVCVRVGPGDLDDAAVWRVERLQP